MLLGVEDSFLPLAVNIRASNHKVNSKPLSSLHVQCIIIHISHVKEKSSYSLRSNDSILLLASTGITKKYSGDWASAVAAPRIWNGLPLEVRNEAKVDHFKQLLRHIILS